MTGEPMWAFRCGLFVGHSMRLAALLRRVQNDDGVAALDMDDELRAALTDHRLLVEQFVIER